MQDSNNLRPKNRTAASTKMLDGCYRALNTTGMKKEREILIILL
jgi:hypothetical protein